jgi:hypothetical protein
MGMVCLLLATASFYFAGCKKSETDPAVMSVETFVQKTKDLIASEHYTGLASEIDFSTTKLVNPGPNQFFRTSLKASDHFARALISIVRPDRKVLQYIIVVDRIADAITVSRMYSLTGYKIGAYRVKDGKIDYPSATPSTLARKTLSDEETQNEFLPDYSGETWYDGETIIPPTDPAIQLNSWWSCTKECVSDCRVACALDSECSTMLIISNLPNGQGVAGLGGLSIGISCGIACAFNKHMDLLPQY